MALSTMVSLPNMNTSKTGALSNQKWFFLYFCYNTYLNEHTLNKIHLVVNICFTVRLPEYYLEMTVAVCGFSFYATCWNYLCVKFLLEDTAASPTVGLFGAEIEQ